MPRTGRFGRLPRAAPNLASIIVQMAREIMALEDSNILKAWEEGGLYKGKPVTDKMLLQHFKGRRDSVPKDDPLWDKWNNQLTQYGFIIAESKMSLKYAQHKVNESQMAAFYTKWANKLPKDSEGYRELMRASARFLDAAQQRSGRGGSSRKSDSPAYGAQMDAAYNKYERPYDVTSQALLEAAYTKGFLQHGGGGEDPDDIFDLNSGDERDHIRFMGLFDGAIINDPDLQHVEDYLRDNGIDPAKLTYEQFVSMAGDKRTGVDTRRTVARAYGEESTAEKLDKEFAELTTNAAVVGDIEPVSAYESMRQELDRKLAEDGLNPLQVAAVLTEHARFLNGLKPAFGYSDDVGFANNEIAAIMGAQNVGPTLYEMYQGAQRTEGNSDAARISMLATDAYAARDKVASGGYVMVQGYATTEAGQGVATWTVVPAAEVSNATGVTVQVSDGMGGTAPAHLTYHNIYAEGKTGVDPRTGRPGQEVNPSGDPLIGKYVVDEFGRTMYFIYGDDGRLVPFNSSPFVTDDMRTDDNGDMILTLTLGPDQVAPAGVGGSGDPTFNPMLAVDQRAKMPDLKYSDRLLDPTKVEYGEHGEIISGFAEPYSPAVAYYIGGPERAQQLLHTTNDQLWASALVNSGGNQQQAGIDFDQMVDLRNQAVTANPGYLPEQLEAQRLNIASDDVLRMGFTQTAAVTPREQQELASRGYLLDESGQVRSTYSPYQLEQSALTAEEAQLADDLEHDGAVAAHRRMGEAQRRADVPRTPTGQPLSAAPPKAGYKFQPTQYRDVVTGGERIGPFGYTPLSVQRVAVPREPIPATAQQRSTQRVSPYGYVPSMAVSPRSPGIGPPTATPRPRPRPIEPLTEEDLDDLLGEDYTPPSTARIGRGSRHGGPQVE